MNVVQFSVEPLLRVAQALPATPRIMAELSRLLSRPDVDLKDVAAQLKRDGALSARLLRIANSAAFSQSEPVASIEDAAALIGLREIHRIAGAIAVDQFTQWRYPLYGFDGRQLRANALLVALLMEEFAPAVDEDSRTAYTAGLFRSFGKLALEILGSEFGGMTPLADSYGTTILAWEKHNFGITANEATATILGHWHFPSEVARAIASHYLPSTDHPPLAHLLHLAAAICDRLRHGLPGESLFCVEDEAAYRHAGLTGEQAQVLVDRAVHTYAQLNHLID